MKLKDLSFFEFDEFAKNHPLASYHQSSNYALFASEQGFDYDLVSMTDEADNIVAATLIIYKKINFIYRYGYAPKGFLLNYYDENIIKNFTTLLKKRYFKKNFAFIKINPEISIGALDYNRKKITYNKNKSIENVLEANGFKKLNNKFFDQKLPKFNATILLKDFSLKNIAKNTRNKINKSIKYGLSIKKASREDINILYKFIKNKKNHQINHYYNYFNAFNNSKNIDIFLIKIDFETCLINLRKSYDKELNKNNILIDKLMHYNNEENLTKKLASDKALTTYQEKIKIVTNYLAQQKEEFIAGAITIKYRNRVNILISGFDKKYKDFCPNYFLHYKLIQYYKKEYDFLDLNGITGDFNDDNPYKGLNEFKFGFKPLAFEYIGEFDFIINEGLYKSMLANGILFKEFNKKQKTITKELNLSIKSRQ